MDIDRDDDDERIPLPAPSPAPVAPLAGKHDELIERWFAASFHGHPAMTVTAAFNHVRKSTDELKRLLAAEEN